MQGALRSYFGSSEKSRPTKPPRLVATASAAIGGFFAGLAQAIGSGSQAGQLGLAGAAIGCLIAGLTVGCCCGLGWGLLVGSVAPQATAVAGRALARLATQAAVSAATGVAHPGYALRPVRRRA